ncbi:hypothetical protein I3760_11G030400 [Carya illinoinensis]|uniref:Recombination initiation defects 3 n=1 Tax=Carya illinoinensis TaxID=32201 RepID=A0A8T1P0P4_CARIL|nr:putative recombination initiation defects 3 isoform X3 [Carya illinoinensis]KAG2679013.1 hypothetical protein I3760_11G030400 [Carya illinoinensis]KAG2679014.1 hypothetical protein I3760_11G030400 [Carya illinoinensis]KAG6635274.1 hypothetical protein CIPAW_11G030900 [Carya illinoinensis]
MKLQINKACDLSAISVLPPHSRRSNSVPTGPQGSQLHSQPSQQSFSQGLSSQHGMFSQLSQNSLNEVLTNDQKFGSQERENSVKKISCLPPPSCSREENQMLILRSSANPIRKWNSASVPEHRCQISEELEHRIGLIETSLSRLGMILDSVQSDVMQASKGTKEVSLDTESIRQKLILHDGLLQLMKEGQEDVKASLAGGFRLISDQLSKETYQDKLQKICLQVSAFAQQMEASTLKLQDKISNTLSKEMQDTAHCATPQGRAQPPMNLAAPPKFCVQANVVPKVESEGWKSVKAGKAIAKDGASNKVQKQNVVSPKQEKSCRINIESDEEIDGGFSWLLEEETGVGKCMIQEAKEETERILRKARRQKRKYRNPIIIN